MSKWHGGKGSKKRSTDQVKYNDNWDRIFRGKKDEHGSSTSGLSTDGRTDIKAGATVKSGA